MVRSRKNNRPSLLFALTETQSVFNRVLRGTSLQFRLTLEKMSTRHIHNTVSGKILVISILRCDTNGSDLKYVGEGGTFIHIFTNKIKNKTMINTNLAFIPR